MVCDLLNWWALIFLMEECEGRIFLERKGLIVIESRYFLVRKGLASIWD